MRYLLAVTILILAAAQPASAQIAVEIGQDATLEKSFQLTNAVSCPRDRYAFLMTPDEAFVRLPTDTIELSKRASTRVTVEFDSAGLAPGAYSANITVRCADCGRCRASTKVLQVEMTVLESAAEIEDGDDEGVPVVMDSESGVAVPGLTGASLADASKRLQELGLEPVMVRSGLGPGNVPTVLEQDPEAGTVVATGSRVTLVPGVRVPNVVGLDSVAAKARLEESRLLLTIEGPLVPAGVAASVAAQAPGADRVVAIGTVVNLSLAAAGVQWRVWLPIVVLSLLVGMVILFLRLSPRTAAAGAARVEVRPRPDPGTQRVWPQASEPQEGVVRVRLTTDAGKQSLQLDPADSAGKE